MKTFEKQLTLRIKKPSRKKDIDSFFCYKINHKEFIKNDQLILKHSIDLKVKSIMFLLTKVARLL